MGNAPVNSNSPLSSHVNSSPRNSNHTTTGSIDAAAGNGSVDESKKKTAGGKLGSLSEEEGLCLSDEDIRLVRNSWKELQSNDLRQYGTTMMIKLVGFKINLE